MDILDIEKIFQKHALPGFGARAWTDVFKELVGGAQTDAHGNVKLRFPGGGAKILFIASLEAEGFTATRVEKSGALWFTGNAPLERVNPEGAAIRFETGAAGVAFSDDCLGDKSQSEYFIDLGTAAEWETRRLVSEADRAVIDFSPQAGLGDSIISCQPVLVGAVAMLRAIESIKQAGRSGTHDVTFLFLAESSAENRDVTPYEGLKPDTAVAVGAFFISDGLNGIKSDCSVAAPALGKGPVISAKGRMFNAPSVYQALAATAERCGVPARFSAECGSLAEAEFLMELAEGVPAAAIGVPVRSGRVYKRADVEASAKLIANFIF